MTTKIVYVLTSDHTDCYLQQAIISIHSLRMYHPDATVIVVVDMSTYNSLTGDREMLMKYASEIKIVECPSHYTKHQCSRHIKTSLRHYIDGDYLFIDTDTIITDSLEEIDQFDFVVGAVLDKHILLENHPKKYDIKKWAFIAGWNIESENMPYFNSGVMFVKDTPEAYEFYDKWNLAWANSILKGVNLDQPALGKILSENNLKITEMNGIWNCQITDNGLRFLSNAKIIHYFASMQQWDTSEEIPYYFRDSVVCEILKKEHNLIPPKIRYEILHAKRAFKDRCIILTGRNLDLMETRLFRGVKWLYFNHYRVYDCLNRFVDRFNKIIR